MTTAERFAQEGAAGADFRALATFLRDLLSPHITAIIAGVDDPGAVEKWANGGASPPSDAVVRLRAAYSLADLLLQAESAGTVRAWFMGGNPFLEDQSPAMALAHGDTAAVLEAAHALLAGAGA